MRKILLVVAFLANLASAATIKNTFDNLQDGASVGSNYIGATFINATALSAGISLNEFEFPPHSGANVAFDDGGTVSISFSTPITSFSGFFTYLSPLTLHGFDAQNTEIALTRSLYSSNLALSGEAGSSPNEFLQMAYTSGIHRIDISGTADGGSFVMDDISYQQAAAVPEPQTYILFLAGILLIMLRERHIISKWLNKARTKSTSCLATLTVFVLLFHAPHIYADEILLPVVSPAALNVNTGTNILISSKINVKNTIPASVNIQRISENGDITVIGSLKDDGTNGDEIANDGVYSGTYHFNENKLGRIGVRVSAAAQGTIKRYTSPTFYIDILPAGAPVSAVSPDLSNTTFDPITGDEIIADMVTACFKPTFSYNQVSTLGSSINAKVVGRLSEIGNCYQFQLQNSSNGSSVINAISIIRLEPATLSAEPDGVVHGEESCSQPTCTFSYPAYANQLHLDEVHDEFGKGDFIKVAILDSGLTQNLFAQVDLGYPSTLFIGPNFISPGPWFDGTAIDDHGHGSNVASILRATAPNAVIHIIRVLGKDKKDNRKTTGSKDQIYLGLMYALKKRVDIVNLSLTGSYNPYIEAAIKQLIKNGIIVIAAAGNNFTNAIPYPAAYKDVLSVGAVDESDVIWMEPGGGGSNWGKNVHIAAPGKGIYGYFWDGSPNYWFSGTSQATPFVAGLAALIKSKYPNMDAIEQMTKTALPIPQNIGKDDCRQPILNYWLCNQALGAGRIDPLAAMGALRITRNSAINFGAIQETEVTISPGLSPAFQTTFWTAGQSQGCQNINSGSFPCIVDIPYDFSKLSSGNHRIRLKTLESGSVSFYATLKLNHPDFTFVSVESGRGSIIDSKTASISLFSFSDKIVTLVVNKK